MDPPHLSCGFMQTTFSKYNTPMLSSTAIDKWELEDECLSDVNLENCSFHKIATLLTIYTHDYKRTGTNLLKEIGSHSGTHCTTQHDKTLYLYQFIRQNR